MSDVSQRSTLGRWMTIALVVNGMIGAGIFTLPSALAEFGDNVPIAWLVVGAGAVAMAYSLSLLARGEDAGAGVQYHIEKWLGPAAGFVAGFSFWVTVWVSNAAVAITGVSALARAVPALSGDATILWMAAATIVGLTLLNSRGARTSGGFTILVVLAKLTPLALVIVLALTLGKNSAAETGESLALALQPLSFDGVAGAAAIAMFALLGFETALALVDKIRSPRRTIPLAMMSGTLFVALLYLAVTSAMSHLLPATTIAESRAPFADVLATGMGGTGVTIALLGMAISAIGYVNAGILIAGDLALALARRGDLPGFLARVDRRGTAIAAQLLASALTLILIAANASGGTMHAFSFAVLLTTSSSLWLYVLGAVAGWRASSKAIHRTVCALALGFAIFLFYGSGLEANAWSIAFLAAGLGLRALLRRRSIHSSAESVA